jgi:hypothetical protein
MGKLLHRAFIFATFGAILLVAFTSGCAGSSNRVSPIRSMAIAITTPNAPPSSQELAAIHRLLQSQIASRGFSVATNLASADYVMRVRFTPDTVNPPGGHLDFLGIEQTNRPNVRDTDNSAVEAGARNLAELRKVISEIQWSDASSK